MDELLTYIVVFAKGDMPEGRIDVGGTSEPVYARDRHPF